MDKEVDVLLLCHNLACICQTVAEGLGHFVKAQSRGVKEHVGTFIPLSIVML